MADYGQGKRDNQTIDTREWLQMWNKARKDPVPPQSQTVPTPLLPLVNGECTANTILGSPHSKRVRPDNEGNPRKKIKLLISGDRITVKKASVTESEPISSLQAVPAKRKREASPDLQDSNGKRARRDDGDEKRENKQDPIATVPMLTPPVVPAKRKRATSTVRQDSNLKRARNDKVVDQEENEEYTVAAASPPPPSTLLLDAPVKSKHFRLGDLPEDLKLAIFEHLGTMDVNSLRCTCKDMAEDTYRYQYRCLQVFPHPYSVAILDTISRDPVRARYVRSVIFEDMMPIGETELWLYNHELLYQDTIGHGNMYQYRRHQDWLLAYREADMTPVAIADALLRFPKLETINSRPGLMGERRSGARSKIPLSDLMRFDGGGGMSFTVENDAVFRRTIRDEYRRRLFNDRYSGRLWRKPPGYDDDWHQTTISIFWKIVEHLLQNRSPSQPLHIKIDTDHWRALEYADAGLRWPTDNAMCTLEINYLSAKLSTFSNNFEDWEILHDMASSTAQLYQGLTEIRLSGVSVEDQGMLPLELPVSPDGTTHFAAYPNLERIDLTDVMIDSDTEKWLSSHGASLKMKNAVVWDKLPADTTQRPTLSGAKWRWTHNTGLYVQMDKKKRMRTRGAPTRDEVWIVGDEEAAKSTAARYRPYVKDRELQSRRRKVPYVSLEAVEDYMLHGGEFPFTRRNMWARTDIMKWHDESEGPEKVAEDNY